MVSIFIFIIFGQTSFGQTNVQFSFPRLTTSSDIEWSKLYHVTAQTVRNYRSVVELNKVTNRQSSYYILTASDGYNSQGYSGIFLFKFESNILTNDYSFGLFSTNTPNGLDASFGPPLTVQYRANIRDTWVRATENNLRIYEEGLKSHYGIIPPSLADKIIKNPFNYAFYSVSENIYNDLLVSLQNLPYSGTSEVDSHEKLLLVANDFYSRVRQICLKLNNPCEFWSDKQAFIQQVPLVMEPQFSFSGQIKDKFHFTKFWELNVKLYNIGDLRVTDNDKKNIIRITEDNKEVAYVEFAEGRKFEEKDIGCYHGELLNNKPDGYGTLILSKSQSCGEKFVLQMAGEFKDGKPHGDISITKNGKLLEMSRFMEGERHGQQMRFF